MAQETAIDTGTLARDISDLRSSLNNAKNQLEDMRASIEALNSRWSGMAHDEFAVQFAMDYENTKEYFATVDFLIESMQNAREQYDLCEGEVNGIIDAIRI